MDISLSTSSSSVRISALSSSRYKRLPIKPTCLSSHLPLKCSNNFPLSGLYTYRSCTITYAKRHQKRISIWACSQIGAAGSDPVLNKVSEFKDAFWRFLRPHTIRGTTLGSISLVARALIENTNLIRWSLLFKAFSGLLALICGNGYIVGINQIYDIGIDKVNKPYLPIAAGDLSVQSAWFLVLLFAVTGLLIVGINFGPFITALYCLGLFLGTIYSVPPFRMKRFPVVAFLIIATVRGFLLNFGVYYATRAALGLTFEWSLPVAFITTFVTLFALVIAITKDLPDVEGDRKVEPRSPAAYFSQNFNKQDPKLTEEWLATKKLYEDMKFRIEAATEKGNISKEVKDQHKGFLEWNSQGMECHSFGDSVVFVET